MGKIKVQEYKKYCVCLERFILPVSLTVRESTDCNSRRFKVLASFDSFEEADEFADAVYKKFLRLKYSGNSSFLHFK